jgi:GntR family transcriptional regulator
VPPRERQPPSQRVEADLRARIEAGEWASGEALPSIATLAGEYGVSRATVAKALRRLADDNLVEIVPQWGTFKT